MSQLACGSAAAQAAGGNEELDKAIRKLEGTSEAALEAQLPKGGEHHYYNNFPDYSTPVQSNIATIQRLLASCEELVRPRRAAQPDWTDPDEVSEWATSLLDDCLEGVDTALDAASGRQRHAGAGGKGALAKGEEEEGPSGDALLMANLPSFGGAAVPRTRQKGPVRHAANLARPQDLFDPPVDNSRDTPFRPQVAHLRGLTAQPLDPQAYKVQPGLGEAYPHPFAHELATLAYEPWQVAAEEPEAPQPVDETPLVFVDQPEQLAAMAQELAGCRHIAIDLEAHSFRSFQGFTCLMQVSSRTTDYVVDALALREHMGPALACLFADPRVVKVLHGADGDVEWLQRDFGLYLVNMFDTGQATRVLALPSNGLAYLLESIEGVAADKRYQLADWRLRPLSADMLHYARCDTHYLLHIYDVLKRQLAEMPQDKVPPSLAVPLPAGSPLGALGLALERSRQLCLRLYHKEAYAPDGYRDVVARWGLRLSPSQTAVFGALWEWRDRMCRADDESGGYVLPKAQLVTLAQDMPDTAKRAQSVLGRGASDVLLRRLGEVVAAIKAAKHAPVEPVDAAQARAAATAAKATAATAQATATAAALTEAGDAAAPAAEQQPGAAAAAARALKPKAVAPITRAGGAGTVASGAQPLQPRAIKPLTSVAASLFGGAPQGTAAPAAESLVPGADGGTAPCAAAGAAARAASLTPVGSLNVWLSRQSSGAAAGGLPRPTKAGADAAQQGAQPPAAAGQAGGLKRPGGSIMGAMFGGGGASTTPPVAAAPAGASRLAVSSGPAGDDALECMKRLKASFTLPFVAAPAAAASQAPAPSGPVQAAVAADAGKGDEGASAEAAPKRTTAADVRAVVEEMRAAGAQEVHVDAQGQGVEVPAEAEAQPGEVAAQEGAGAGPGVVAGEELGLDTLDFVPVPLSQMYGKGKSKRGGGGGGGGGGMRDGSRSGAKRAAAGRKFVTELPGVQRQQHGEGDHGHSSDQDEGAGTSDSSSDDDGPMHGPFAKKRRGQQQQRGRGGQEQQQQDVSAGADGPAAGSSQARVTPFDYGTAQQEQQMREKQRQRAGPGTGPLMQGRGTRGGRGGRGQAGRGGRPVFNPFDIAEEDLIKGGKRSSVMPRSGNKSHTFK